MSTGRSRVGSRKSSHVGNAVGRDVLADFAPGRAYEDRAVTVVEAAVDTLDVSCACGKAARKFPQADVRSGACQWWCGRRGCEEPS